MRAQRYARVSTYGQTLDAQLDQLRADGLHLAFSGVAQTSTVK
jgi:DNA invertase Pin-like site-specific DNA recombinase